MTSRPGSWRIRALRVLSYVALAGAFFLAVPAVPSVDASGTTFVRPALLASVCFAGSRVILSRIGPSRADIVVESLLFFVLLRAIYERVALH